MSVAADVKKAVNIPFFSNSMNAAPTSMVTPAKKSSTCQFAECSSRPVKIVGHCRYCDSDFCAKHRFVESHNCEKMQACKDASKEALANKLMSEKSVCQNVLS